MCFHVTTARRALAFVVIINVIGGALEAWRNPGLAGALTALGIAAFAITFAYVYSRWMARVIEQSLDRAALIEQLEATRAELAAAHHEAGVQAERHRLAGEIHDTLAQGFTSIVTLLQAGQASLDAASPARRHLDLALLTARENLAEARTLVTALTPATLEAGTLGDTVRRVTSATGAQAGIEAHAEVTGTARRLPTGTEVVLLRVCQEALANVRKHAGARQVRVRLCYAGATVRLTVTDDGKGFDPGGATGGYGLKGMRDRVSQVGGTVEVASVPGRGTAGQRGGARMIRVLLADDHPVVRAGLRGMLAAEADIEVAGEAASGPEAVARARTGGFDVILMDLRMPGGDGVAATEHILAADPGARVLILTTYETDADILRAVEAGATGYLLKDATPAELAGAVRAAARGETVLAPSVAERLISHVRRPPRESLSARETEVLAQVARGRTNAEIGQALFISEATVKTHLLRVFGKLGVSGRTAAVTTAIERGLLPPPGGNR